MLALALITLAAVSIDNAEHPRPTQPAMSPPATLLVTNARVWTADPQRPWAEAVAIGGERILAVGSTQEIERLAGPATRRVDARGSTVTPGLIDAHVHFLDGGFGLASVQLRDARTPGDFARRIGEFAAKLPAGR